MIGFGVHDATRAERIIRAPPALATFGAIVGALVGPGLEARQREDDARASVQAILDAGAFAPFFQPIVEFHSGAVVGYEALSRLLERQSRRTSSSPSPCGPGWGTSSRRPPSGPRAGRRRRSCRPGRTSSLNASPTLIASGRLPPPWAAASGDRPRITEHVEIDDYAALRHELAALGPTVRLAVDDAGAGYASLRHILELAPEFVKLDIGLIRGINADPARQALIAGMGYFAVKRKLRLIAEGVETPEEFRALRGLAIGCGQGYLLGPSPGRSGAWAVADQDRPSGVVACRSRQPRADHGRRRGRAC